MSRGKKKLILIAILTLTIVLSWLYLDWELYQIKKGNVAPVWWDSVDEYSAELLTFTNPHRKMENFGITMTDFYVFPELNRLHFGFWYKKWIYNTKNEETPEIVFSFTLIDNEGKEYPANRFIISDHMSVFERFQRRGAEGIDIGSIETLTLKINLLRNEKGIGDQIVETQEFMIYDSKVDRLSKF